MKITVITICLNNFSDIESTIKSVISQNYNNIEYIVIDGGSSDGTLDIIHSYSKHMALIVSEKDNGIYGAINKGILASTGKVVGLLHAGDEFYDNNVLQVVSERFNNSKVDLIYGHSIILNKKSKAIVRMNKSPSYNSKLLNLGWFPSHQSIYAKRSVFDECGLYKEKYKIAGDYEFFLRAAMVCKVRIERIDMFFIKFYLGGTSTNSIENRFLSNYECILAWKENNLKMPVYTIFYKILRKIYQKVLWFSGNKKNAD
jgi:glycosyltransferase